VFKEAKMHSKKGFVVCLVVVMVVLLAACAPVAPGQPATAPQQPAAPDVTAAPPAAASQEKVELVFRQGDPPGEVEGLQVAIDKWNAANPNIQVRMETVPWSDAQSQLVREVQAGGGPDVAQIAFVWTRDLGRSGLLMELTDRLKSDPPGMGFDDFLGTDLGEDEGRIYGVPWTVDTYVMGYRPDLFENAGIAEFPDTWEDFFTAAKQLSVDTNGDGRTDQYGFCFPAGSAAGGGMWFLVNYYIWSNGKTFVEQGADGNWQVGVTAEDVAAAMRYYDGFFKEGATPESLIAISSWGDPEIVGGIARGDCAIAFFPPGTFRAAEAQSEQPLMTAPIPRGSVQRISHLGGRTLAINPHTKHVEEAWQFLKYLASAETFQTYNQFPAQESLLDELTFRESEQGWVLQLPHAITFKQYIISPATVNSMWEATNREFGGMYAGQKTIEQASADLVAAMENLLQEN
jgi:multiple sugar transport system substrate-binding protein